MELKYVVCTVPVLLPGESVLFCREHWKWVTLPLNNWKEVSFCWHLPPLSAHPDFLFGSILCPIPQGLVAVS